MREKHIGRLLSKFKKDTPIGENLLDNGNFQIIQRGAGPFTNVTNVVNNDDSYLLDRWIFLAEGSDTCDVSQDTTSPPSGAYSCLLLDVETANRKFAICQVMESRNSIPLTNQTVSLSFQAKVTGTSISNIRAAVISWSSTADTVTSDIMASWASSGTNPTLAANWTYENAPENLPITTSYQTFRIDNILIDTASMTNVGVAIWVDDTDAIATDVLRIGNVKLEIGEKSTDFVHKKYQDDLIACQRHFYGIVDTSGAGSPIGNGYNASTTLARINIKLPNFMRIPPTTTSTGAVNFEIQHAAGPTTLSSISWDSATFTVGHMIAVGATVAAGLTTGQSSALWAKTSSAYVLVSAEL